MPIPRLIRRPSDYFREEPGMILLDGIGEEIIFADYAVIGGDSDYRCQYCGMKSSDMAKCPNCGAPL